MAIDEFHCQLLDLVGQWKADLYMRVTLASYELGRVLSDASHMLRSKTQSEHLH